MLDRGELFFQVQDIAAPGHFVWGLRGGLSLRIEPERYRAVGQKFQGESEIF